MFQAFNLLPTLTAEESSRSRSPSRGAGSSASTSNALVERVGLTDRRGHRPGEMSGGEQQRVAIARALATRPTVLFADEPTGNLDSSSCAEVLGTLRETVERDGQTILMATHDPKAATVADRVPFLADGRMVAGVGALAYGQEPLAGSSPVPLTLGTAGHIDHGKTALVSALTGVDTDRLPEERRRGISIELGYAELTLPSARTLSVIDVPGHERFVRTMVAGATGIDLFLMVVAADDGVMPQTREHAAVLRALGVEAGVVAVTKADMADPRRAMGEAAELLPGVPVLPVSARSGAGIPELLAALDGVAVPARSDDGAAVLHVDRVFTIHGAGTVVTGTLWSGSVGRGDEVTVMPRGVRARVRGVQVHDAPADRAGAGQRVAVNLVLGRDAIARGDVLVGPGHGVPRATYRIAARLDCTPGAPRVTVHHGTRESPARVVHLGGDEWQLRLESQLVAAAGDRLVIRTIAPPDTLGGGTVLDPSPPRSRHAPAPASTSQQSGTVPLHEAGLSPIVKALPVEVEERLRAAGHEPPLDTEFDGEDLAALRAHGRAVRVGPAMHFHVEALAEVERRLRALLEREGSVTLAQFRDELGTSRKYAQALLEHFDSERVTLRVGDERVLRSRSTRPG